MAILNWCCYQKSCSVIGRKDFGCGSQYVALRSKGKISMSWEVYRPFLTKTAQMTELFLNNPNSYMRIRSALKENLTLEQLIHLPKFIK